MSATVGFRALKPEELELIAGGYGTTIIVEGYVDITVTGHPPGYGEYDPRWDGNPFADDGNGQTGSSDSEIVVVATPPKEPDCNVADKVVLLPDFLYSPVGGGDDTLPDDVEYYIPESVTQKYILDAINFAISLSQLTNRAEAYLAIYNMYTNPTDPHFVDFKDWGTSAGPPGSVSGGEISYYSNITGADVVTSPFEAFGNFFYGLITSYAGLGATEVQAVAAAVQNLQGGSAAGAIAHILEQLASGVIPQDDPRDQPHVALGIAAVAYQNATGGWNGSLVTLVKGSCS